MLAIKPALDTIVSGPGLPLKEKTTSDGLPLSSFRLSRHHVFCIYVCELDRRQTSPQATTRVSKMLALRVKLAFIQTAALQRLVIFQII